MSIHVEWATATETHFYVALPGEFEDSYGTTNTQTALVVDYGEAFVIEGNLPELVTMLSKALASVGKAMLVPAPGLDLGYCAWCNEAESPVYLAHEGHDRQCPFNPDRETA